MQSPIVKTTVKTLPPTPIRRPVEGSEPSKLAEHDPPQPPFLTSPPHGHQAHLDPASRRQPQRQHPPRHRGCDAEMT